MMAVGRRCCLLGFKGADGEMEFEMPENMTLRDWLAGMALQGLLASGEAVPAAGAKAVPAGVKDAARRSALVALAYGYADSMLAKKEEFEVAEQSIDDEEEEPSSPTPGRGAPPRHG
jgi:hypothetical protein